MRNLFLGLIFFPLYFFTQSKNEIDSFKKVISQLKENGVGKNIKIDTALIRNLSFLSKKLYFVSIKEAKTNILNTIKLTDSLFTNAKTISSPFHKKSLAYLFKALSIVLENEGNIDSAILCLDKTIKLVPERENAENAVKSYSSLSYMFSQKGNNKKALEYLFLALNVSEKNNYQNGIASANQKLSNFYCYQEKYTTALPYMLKAVSIREKINDIPGLLSDYNNLANIYGYLNRDKEAYNLLQKALKISREKSLYNHEALTLNNISYYFMDLKDFEKALYYSKAGYELRKRIGDKDGELKSMISLSMRIFMIKELFLI